MKKSSVTYVLLWLGICNLHAQQQKIVFLEKGKPDDSVYQVPGRISRDVILGIPVVDEEGLRNTNDIPGELSLNASRDPFDAVAGFQFSSMRFQPRGWGSGFSEVTVNGIPMTDLSNGYGLWNTWSGLNEVFRINETGGGISQTNFSAAVIGQSSNMDIRASHQRPQTSIGYAFSNRSYNHRFQLSHSSGFNQRGWAFSFCGSAQKTMQAMVPGTFNDAGGFYLGVDKKIGFQIFSLAIFAVDHSVGKQAAILEESEKLSGDHLYNPYWGYQHGAVRNANIAYQCLPVILFTNEYRFSNQNFLQTSIAFSAGSKGNTGLDWYHAPDPRPDYYRYLPSFQTDPVLQSQVASMIQLDPNKRQMNWDQFFAINRANVETINDANGILGNQVSGKRARYILENRMTDLSRFSLSSSYHAQFREQFYVDLGLHLSLQRQHFYKSINDLLGADFYVNWNQFAENETPVNAGAIQNDLNRPNQILREHDHFGYDYSFTHQRGQGWMQMMIPLHRFNVNLGASLSLIRFWREGFVRNGLFPLHSFGNSAMNLFLNGAFKTGLSYAINGKQTLYISATLASKAPDADNLFISPRTRDTKQEQVMSESLVSTELGYLIKSAGLKMHASVYYNRMKNGLDILSFYHDGYNSFVNYAISGIGQTHAGIEFGMDAKISGGVNVQMAAVNSVNFFDCRQLAIVTADNTADILQKSVIYAKNFQSTNTPQSAYSIGIDYRTMNQWFGSLHLNFFDQQWMGWNPIRRTAEAIFPVAPETEKGMLLLRQQEMQAQWLANLFISKNIRLGKQHLQNWVISLSVGNLLNDQHLITGSFEQLRFDFDNKDPAKFPPKYLNAPGRNFLLSLTYRF